MPTTLAARARPVALALTAMLLVTCASDPMMERRVASAARGFDGSFGYLYVESVGTFGDDAFMVLSKVAGNTLVARDLADRLRPAATMPVRMMVTGPVDAKTVQVITDAFEAMGGTALPELQFMYIGDPAYEASVRELVERVGGRFLFVAAAPG